MTKSFHRLILLLPFAFVLHVGEEYLSGYPAWASAVSGHPMGLPIFLGSNIGFILVMAMLTRWTTRARTPRAAFWLLAWTAGNLFWNFVYHAGGVLAYGLPAPGLYSATLIYLPLTLMIWRAALKEKIVSPAALTGTIAIGGAFMGAVAAIGIYHLGGV